MIWKIERNNGKLIYINTMHLIDATDDLDAIEITVSALDRAGMPAVHRLSGREAEQARKLLSDASYGAYSREEILEDALARYRPDGGHAATDAGFGLDDEAMLDDVSDAIDALVTGGPTS